MNQVDRLRLCGIVELSLWLKMESKAAFIRCKRDCGAAKQVSVKPLKCVLRAMEYALRLTRCTQKDVYNSRLCWMLNDAKAMRR